MASYTKTLLCFVLLLTLFSVDAKRVRTGSIRSGSASGSNKKTDLKEHSKHAEHLKNAMAQVQKQLDDHYSGLRSLDGKRRRSLMSRMAKYEGLLDQTRQEIKAHITADVIEDSDDL